MSEAFTTPEDRRAMWRWAIVVGGAVLIIAMLGTKAHASIGDNEDRRTVSRHDTSSVAHAVPRRATRSGRASRPHAPPGRRPAAPITAKTAYASAIIAHPRGCPRTLYCGCGASLEAFGHIIPKLKLAANWFMFPRAAPAPGMAAVRRGHVFIIAYMIDANTAMAIDHNSGNHLSRRHARRLDGYTVVNPHAVRVASLGNGKP